jgi:hypothetical protein
MAEPQQSQVPVAPNASDVSGTVVAVEPEPGGWGTVVVAIDEASDVGAFPNFVRPHIGQTIRVAVPPRAARDVPETGPIQARIAFRGDERGGRFVVIAPDAV